MNRKKLLKGFKIIASVLFVMIILLVVVVFWALPTPVQIREGMFASTRKMIAKPTPAVPSAAAVAPAQLPAGTPAPEATPSSEDEFAKHKRENEEIFEKFMAEGEPLSSACASLGSIKYPQNKKISSREFSKRFEESIKGAHNDPEFDSARPFLKFTLMQPSVRSLIDEVKRAEPGSVVESIKAKTKFYSMAYDVYLDLKTHEDEMRTLLDQNYLTMMLGRAVEAKPILAHDRATQDYCEEIEKHINERTPPDFAQEKKAFEEFLAKNEIDPKAIGYDPHYVTNLKIEFGSDRVEANGGWINDFFMQAKPAQ